MAYREKIEQGVSDYIGRNNAKPNFLILHPGFTNALAREIFADNPFNLQELSSFFGMRIISSSDIDPNEVVVAR